MTLQSSILGVYARTVRVKQESAKLAGGLEWSRTEASGKPPEKRHTRSGGWRAPFPTFRKKAKLHSYTW